MHFPSPARAGRPGAEPVPRRARPARPGLGRPARPRPRRLGHARAPHRAASTAPSSSATRSSGRRRPSTYAARCTTCRGSEVHVVYSARDLGRQVPAAWQESIKQGRTWTYRRFQRRMVRGQPVVRPGLRPAARAGDLGRGPAARADPRRHRPARPARPAVAALLRVSAPTPPGRRARPSGSTARSASPRPSCCAGSTAASDDATRRGADIDELVRHMLARPDARQPPRHAASSCRPHLHPWAVAEADRWTALDHRARRPRRRRPRRPAARPAGRAGATTSTPPAPRPRPSSAPPSTR